MNMMSEIATEQTIRTICQKIAEQLQAAPCPHTEAALKTLGQFALEQFEWSTPEWAKQYHKLFTLRGVNDA